MKIAIICYLFLMNVINFDAVAESFQHKVDSLSESKCDSLFEVIHKAEKHISLKSSDVSLLMESYENASLRNNTELEECRSEAIIHIMYDTCNVKTLLYVIKDNTKYRESFVDELQHPVRDMKANSTCKCNRILIC